jgi:hypothetical protein
MSVSTQFLRNAVPALAVFALLFAPISLVSSADEAPAVKSESMHDTCLVCNMSMKNVTDKKTMTVDGRTMQCCSVKCSDAITGNKEYYKGMHDGVERSEKSHIGPKGGDTRKGPQPQN